MAPATAKRHKAGSLPPGEIGYTALPVSTAAARALECLPTIESEFCRPGDCLRLFGLKRAMVYELDRRGLIRSVSLRQKGAARGCRLVSVPSVRAYLAGLMDRADERAADHRDDEAAAAVTATP